MNEATPEYSHFTAFNALIDAGWLAVLSKLELAVWLVYLRHADDSGNSFPGPRRIADRLEHRHVRHVREARTRLITLGLLAVTSEGGGRSPAKMLVNIPPTPPRIGPRSKSATPALNRGRHPAPNRAYQAALNRGRHPAPNRGNDQPIDQPIEGPSINSSGGIAAVAGGKSSTGKKRTGGRKKPHRDAREQEAYDMLKSRGIGEPTRSRLLQEVPSLTGTAVAEIAAGLDAGAESGMLVLAIRADGADTVEELKLRNEEERIRGASNAEKLERQQRRIAWGCELEQRYQADPLRNDAIVEALADHAGRNRYGEIDLKNIAALSLVKAGTATDNAQAMQMLDEGEMRPDAFKMLIVDRMRQSKPEVSKPVDDRFDRIRTELAAAKAVTA